MNTVSVTLDLSKKPGTKPCVFIGGTDRNAPILEAKILDHGIAFDLSGYSVSFEMLKPSGGVYSITGTAQGNTATFALSGMEPGKSDIAYVVIESGDRRISTQRMNVEVLEGANQ